MATPPITVEFSQKGMEQVKAAFTEIAEASKRTSREVAESSTSMTTSIRNIGYELTALGVAGRSITELATHFGVLTEAEAKQLIVATNLISAFSGLITGLPRIISLISKLASITVTATIAEWAHVAALQAKALAAGIAHAVASLGAAVPIIIAAAAAATAGIMAYTGKIPKHHYTGTVTKTGPQILEAGEYILSKETVREFTTLRPVVSPTPVQRAPVIIYGGIHVHEALTPRETGSEVVRALERTREI